MVRSNQRLRWHLSEFERPDHTVLGTSDAWETDIESQGHDPAHQDLRVEQIPPPQAIAARLNLDPRTDVCVARRHVRYIEGNPAIISDDYFDEKIVRGTELAAPEDTTREDILKEAGYDKILAIALDPDIAEEQVGVLLRERIGMERMRAAWTARKERLQRITGIWRCWMRR